MKNKKYQLAFSQTSLFSILLTLLLMVSCKKNADFNENEPSNKSQIERKTGGSVPNFNTAIELNEHLKWIARGLAHWQKPTSLVKGIDSLLNLNFNDSNENPILYLNTIYTFDSTLTDSINVRYPSNNFSPNGLHSFTVNNRTYYTKLYAPNNFYASSKPFVVVPAETPTDSNHSMNVTGYLPKSGGGIDSVIINDLNEDDYYIWVVDYYHLSEYDDEFEASSGDGIRRKSGRVLKCDNDGVCEGGEIYNPNCTDCYPAPPQKYKLVLTHLEVFRDNCPKASRFLDGRYEFAMSYGLYDNLGTSSSNLGEIDDYYNNINIKRVKRKDLCRERCPWGGSKGSNCPSGVFTIDYEIYKEIVPSDSNCRMPFLFYEYDFDPFKWYADQYHGFWELVPGKGFTDDGYFVPYYYSWQAAYAAVTVNVYAMWQANNHNGSFIWVGNNEARIRIELIKL